MKEFTKVILLAGPTKEGGYIFKCKEDPCYKFECEYDGTDVVLNFMPIIGRQPRLQNKLKVLYGLLHEKSNFRKVLFYEFLYLNNKKLERIIWKYMDFVFVINKKSDIDELIRKYYRTHNYVVLDTDTEKDILNRNNKLFKLAIFIRERFHEDIDVSDIYFKYHNTICFNEKDFHEIEEKIEKEIEERYKEYLAQYDLNENSSEEAKELLKLIKNKSKLTKRI